jgi:hypothetical protein
MTRKLLAIFAVVCLCVMIYPQFGMIATANSTANFPVDVLLDYGNGTRTWSTCILSTPGYDTAFNATQVAADTLNYTVSEYGVFVNAINGVWGNSTHWWSLFFWNFTSGNWTSSPLGAIDLVLSIGDMVAWVYGAHSWPPVPPIRGDSDGDGDIDYEDIVSFVDAYIAYKGQEVLDPEHREGDMDNDGDIDYGDITSFVDAYIAYWSQGN